MAMSMVDKAMEIAFRAHHGQVNSHDGEPYILHVQRVVLTLKDAYAHTFLSPRDIAIAWLHDVVEDNGDWTLHRIEVELSAVTGPNEVKFIVMGLDAITKRHGESNEEYYNRVKRHEGARRVKYKGDIPDNFRRNHLIEDDATRLRMAAKYSLGMDILGGI